MPQLPALFHRLTTALGPTVSPENPPPGFVGRFSLSKPFTAVTYQEFRAVVLATHTIAEQTFGTPCDIAVEGYKAPPTVTSFRLDESPLGDKINTANQAILVADMPSLLAAFGAVGGAGPSSSDPVRTTPRLAGSKSSGTAVPVVLPHNAPAGSVVVHHSKSPMEQLWDASRYVAVKINPVIADQAPPYSTASIEFGGYFPKAASFFVQPNYGAPNCGWAASRFLRASFPRWMYDGEQKEHENNISGDLAHGYFKSGMKFW